MSKSNPCNFIKNAFIFVLIVWFCTISLSTTVKGTDRIKSPTIDFSTLSANVSACKLGEKIIWSVKVSDDSAIVPKYFQVKRGNGDYCSCGCQYDGSTQTLTCTAPTVYSGLYEIAFIELSDSNGNTIRVMNSGFSDPSELEGYKREEYTEHDLSAVNVQVEGTNDSSPPTIDFSTLSANVSACKLGEKIIWSVKVSDDSAIVPKYFQVKRGNGDYCSCGCQYDGSTQTLTCTAPTVYSGLYEIAFIELSDSNGNTIRVMNSGFSDPSELEGYKREEYTEHDLSAVNVQVEIEFDFNHDETLNETDLKLLARHIAKIEPLADATLADVNGDEEVNAKDLTALARLLKQ